MQHLKYISLPHTAILDTTPLKMVIKNHCIGTAHRLAAVILLLANEGVVDLGPRFSSSVDFCEFQIQFSDKLSGATVRFSQIPNWAKTQLKKTGCLYSEKTSAKLRPLLDELIEIFSVRPQPVEIDTAELSVEILFGGEVFLDPYLDMSEELLFPFLDQIIHEPFLDQIIQEPVEVLSVTEMDTSEDATSFVPNVSDMDISEPESLRMKTSDVDESRRKRNLNEKKCRKTLADGFYHLRAVLNITDSTQADTLLMAAKEIKRLEQEGLYLRQCLSENMV